MKKLVKPNLNDASINNQRHALVIATVRNDPAWDVRDTFAVTLRKVSSIQFVVNIVRVVEALPWNQEPVFEWMAWE